MRNILQAVNMTAACFRPAFIFQRSETQQLIQIQPGCVRNHDQLILVTLFSRALEINMFFGEIIRTNISNGLNSG